VQQDEPWAAPGQQRPDSDEGDEGQVDDHDEIGQQPVEHRSRERTTLVCVTALLCAAAAAYAWWAAGLRPFTWPALVAVAAAGVAAIVVGTRRRRPGTPRPDGAVLWVALVALLAAWELAAYVQAPRADHPTLSSLANEVLDWHPLRAVAFLGWVAAGVELARR
jgi:hypothetical protein